MFCFYDGEQYPSPDPFAEFKRIKLRNLQAPNNTDAGFRLVKFSDALQGLGSSKEQRGTTPMSTTSIPAGNYNPVTVFSEGQRGRFACLMVTGFDRAFIDAMDRQAQVCNIHLLVGYSQPYTCIGISNTTGKKGWHPNFNGCLAVP